MDDAKVKTIQISALFSLLLVSIANTCITIGKELSEDFKGFFVAITGHHWTGHGVVILILFILFMLIGYLLVEKDVISKDIDIYKLALITIIIMIIVDVMIPISLLIL